jgi:LPS export ABC transporter protein LptC
VIQRRTRRGIILLALLATLSWILSRDRGEVTEQPVSKLDTRLNYALYDFEGRLLNVEGAVNLEIHAPVLRSNARSGVGTVESPELRIQEEDERWYITAESAIITANREHVSLMGDVYLARRNELTGQLLEISTKDVMLNVTPRTASSESRVSITQDNDRLDAVGIRLDMISNSFELLNDVQAHYETP